MQMVMAYAAIANGGFLMRPYLVRRVVGPKGEVLLENQPHVVRRVVSEKTSRLLASMLKEVTNEGGTGMMAKVEGFEVAGKTGTAQKADLAHGGYAAKKRVGSFVGFVPADAPRLVALVLVDEPEVNVYGGVVAAPVFRNIAQGALRHLAVAPQKPDLVPRRGWPSRTSRPASPEERNRRADGSDRGGAGLRRSQSARGGGESASYESQGENARERLCGEAVSGARRSLGRGKHFGFKPPRLSEMRLREFLALQEVEEAEGDLDQEVTGLTYDSRQVGAGEIFFAIPGEKVDGHEFIPQALRRGAAAVVVARKGSWPQGTTWIRTKDVRRTMGLWGAHFYGRPSRRMKLVGVTGTNGKTTVTYLVESILSAAGLEPGVIGTINYRYRGRQVPSHHTTPESLELQSLLAEMETAGVKSVAMEVSSHALVQERVRGIDFDVGVFTNLSRDHLDYHRDMDDYFSAKSRLFTDYLKVSVKPKKAAVIYAEDARGRELLRKLRDAGLEAWSYGEDSAVGRSPRNGSE